MQLDATGSLPTLIFSSRVYLSVSASIHSVSDALVMRQRPCITTASDALPKPPGLFHDALGLLGELSALEFCAVLHQKYLSNAAFPQSLPTGILTQIV